MNIIPIDTVDPQAVEELLDTVFGEDRHGRTAYKVREGLTALPALSFAALDESGALVGSIQCWPVMLETPEHSRHPMIMVGPVAVAPDHQDQGIGRALMAAIFAGLGKDETMPLVLIGDPEYYGRHFGYSDARTSGWRLPGPYEQHRLLARCRDDVPLPGEGLLGPYRLG